MKTSERYHITAVRLVEFHNLGTTTVTIPDGGHLFLLGDNGSGKTTLLDAIHLVLTAGREMEFNAAARVAGAKDSGGRTYQGVVLRYNAVTGRTHRESGVTYAAVELRSDQGHVLSLVVGLAADGMDVAIERWGGMASVPVAELPLTVKGGDEGGDRLRAATQREFKTKIAALKGGRAYTHINEYAEAVGERLFGGNDKYADVCKLLRTGKAYREIAARSANYDELFRQLLEDPSRETFEPLLTGLRELDHSKATLDQIDERAHYLKELRRESQRLADLRLKTDILAWVAAERERETAAVEVERLSEGIAAGEGERTVQERAAVVAKEETTHVRERLAELRAKDATGLVNQEKQASARCDEATRKAEEARREAAAKQRRAEGDAAAAATVQAERSQVAKRAGEALQKAAKVAALGAGAVTDLLFAAANDAETPMDEAPFAELRKAVGEAFEERTRQEVEARRCVDEAEGVAETARQELAALKSREESLPNVSGFERTRTEIRAALLGACPLYEGLEPAPGCDARHLAFFESLLGDGFLATWIADGDAFDAVRRAAWQVDGALTVARRGDAEGVDVTALTPWLGTFISFEESDVEAVRLVAAHLAAKGAPGDAVFLSFKTWEFRARQGVLSDARPRLIGRKARAAEQARLVRAAEERLAAAEKAVKAARRWASDCAAALASVKELDETLETARTNFSVATANLRQVRDRAASSAEFAAHAAAVAQTRQDEAARVRAELDDVRLKMRAAGIDGALEKKIAAVERKVRAGEERIAGINQLLGEINSRVMEFQRVREERRRVVEAARARANECIRRFAAVLPADMEIGAFARAGCPAAFAPDADFNRLREGFVSDAKVAETVIGQKIREAKGEFYSFAFDRAANRLTDRRGSTLDDVIADETRRLEELRGVINQKTREVFERIFKGEVMRRLNINLHAVEDLVRRIQRKLAGRRFGSNRYAFEIAPVPEYESFVDLVRRGSLYDPDESDEKLHACLEAHRDEIMNADLDCVPDIFDYRKWFRFQLKVVVENEEGRVIDRKVKSMGSGGEQAVPNYLLILTVAEFLYHGGEASDPPKVAPLLFDEAFYGIDAARRDQLLAFAEDLGLQLFVSSPDQDGVKREIRHSVSLIVVKDENLDVHLSPVVWNNAPVQTDLLSNETPAVGMTVLEEV